MKMKNIIEFLKENGYNDYILETLSNGVDRVVIEIKDSLSAKEIIEKAESNGFRAMATVYGVKRNVAIYNKKGWEKMMERFKPTTINTIEDKFGIYYMERGDHDE